LAAVLTTFPPQVNGYDVESIAMLITLGALICPHDKQGKPIDFPELLWVMQLPLDLLYMSCKLVAHVNDFHFPIITLRVPALPILTCRGKYVEIR